LRAGIPVDAVQHHVNDQEFARATADAVLELAGVATVAEELA
jgi:hypothetical protein